MFKVGTCQKCGEIKSVGKKNFNVMLCYFHLSIPNTSSLWGIFICPDCIVGLQTTLNGEVCSALQKLAGTMLLLCSAIELAGVSRRVFAGHREEEEKAACLNCPLQSCLFTSCYWQTVPLVFLGIWVLPNVSIHLHSEQVHKLNNILKIAWAVNPRERQR